MITLTNKKAGSAVNEVVHVDVLVAIVGGIDTVPLGPDILEAKYNGAWGFVWRAAMRAVDGHRAAVGDVDHPNLASYVQESGY